MKRQKINLTSLLISEMFKYRSGAQQNNIQYLGHNITTDDFLIFLKLFFFVPKYPIIEDIQVTNDRQVRA